MVGTGVGVWVVWGLAKVRVRMVAMKAMKARKARKMMSATMANQGFLGGVSLTVLGVVGFFADSNRATQS